VLEEIVVLLDMLNTDYQQHNIPSSDISVTEIISTSEGSMLMFSITSVCPPINSLTVENHEPESSFLIIIIIIIIMTLV